MASDTFHASLTLPISLSYWAKCWYPALIPWHGKVMMLTNAFLSDVHERRKPPYPLCNLFLNLQP